MPNIIIMILSLTGRILLGLLALILLLLLLILFFPVTYRLRGERREDRLTVSARADWLFGVLRVRYSYPEPGSVTVKLLWKKLAGRSAGSAKGTGRKTRDRGAEASDTGDGNRDGAEASGTETGGRDGTEAAGTEPGGRDRAEAAGTEPGGRDGASGVSPDADGKSVDMPVSGFRGKISKIKYTILKIYGRIKDICEHLSYYAGVLREDDTVALWKHVRQRLGKMLRSLRPRRLKGFLVFGTGAPDTTGYLFGVYGMLSPSLNYDVCVTPDFTQKILEGNISISGYFTIWVLTWNVLKLLLDKRLRLFMKKMKAGRREAESKV